MEDVALALIHTGLSKPDYIGIDECTALQISCKYKMEDVALALINTGLSLPNHVSFAMDSAIMEACKNNMSEAVLALIPISTTHILNLITFNNNTLLFVACNNNMTSVALELTKQKLTNDNVNTIVPHIYTNNGNKGTALEVACIHNLKEVAIAIIKTFKIKRDNHFTNALNIAKRKKWVQFIKLANPFDEELIQETHHPTRFQHSLRKHGYSIDTGDYQEVHSDDDNPIINPPEHGLPKRFGKYSEKAPYQSHRSMLSENKHNGGKRRRTAKNGSGIK